ncbi:hypothetical protein [Streptomyces xiaopingdaonensis]|uniref:baeRF3 domain-containing protein n=1 Tax=Streptomyces xiaopingdaonensis TaxID=1565415 RepID=UPI00037777F0|nr:hypothetical protein [Streptomyces xiaopingdaonensis]
MRTTDLSDAVLAALRKPRPYPAVTLVVPTHRTRPDNQQDPVRVRNLVAGVAKRLHDDAHVAEDVRADVTAQLEQAEEEVDHVHALDTLVLFAARGEHQVWYLPRSAGERVVVGETFLTRNLVAATAQARRYWVLCFDERRARLWSGSDLQVTEARRDGFPVEAPIEEGVELTARETVAPSGYRHEAARQYLRAVDAALGRLLENEPRRLCLVALRQGLSALEDVGAHHARSADAVLAKGGLADAPGHVLAAALEPALAELDERRTAFALERLGSARGNRTFAAGLDEVWTSAHEARLSLLVVEESYRETVRVEEGHLRPVSDEEARAAGLEEGLVDDIVDETVETALSTDAEVVFVPEGTLAEHGRIAGVVRYSWTAA